MPEQDPQIRKNTLLALNMAVAAVKAIEETADRVVLQQQYDAILKNLNVGRIDPDPELRALYTRLLETIAASRLDESQRRRFVSAYDAQQKKSIFEGLGNAFKAAGSNNAGDAATAATAPWLALGKALLRGASAYFGYREAKKQKKIELDEKIWRLDQDKIKAIDALQIQLFNASWAVLSKTAAPNERRLTDDDLRGLERATQDGTAEQTRFLLSWEEDKYHDYPPYWFYRGEAALNCGDEVEARSCFDRFDRAGGDVLIRDPYKAQAAKYRIRLEPQATPEFIKSQLAVIRAHAEEWSDLLFYAVTSYAVGERAQGIGAVKYIMYKGWESEISPVVLRAMESGRFDPAELLAGMGVTGFDRLPKNAPAALDVSETAERERARREAEERAAKEAAERARKEAEERAAQENAERARREQQEREDQARLDRLRAEAGARERELKEQLEKERAERAAFEQRERERQQAEARARAQKEAEERARREQGEREERLRKEEERLRAEAAERERKLKEQIAQERGQKAAIVGVGITVTLGRYVQSFKIEKIEKKGFLGGVQVIEKKVPNEPEPIEWIVLAHEGEKKLLISKYGLDCKQYHHDYKAGIWEHRDLRRWLNGEFLNAAFSAEEQTKIVEVTNQNPKNEKYGTAGGEPTRDKIFLLSIDEAELYFQNNGARKCRPTDYAKTTGAEVRGNGCCWWWLRSPGRDSLLAARVDDGGAVSVRGDYVDSVDRCVRPALWVSNL